MNPDTILNPDTIKISPLVSRTVSTYFWVYSSEIQGSISQRELHIFENTSPVDHDLEDSADFTLEVVFKHLPTIELTYPVIHDCIVNGCNSEYPVKYVHFLP